MSETAFKLSQVSNVMLGVRDLARSMAFYRDTPGLARKRFRPGNRLPWRDASILDVRKMYLRSVQESELCSCLF